MQCDLPSPESEVRAEPIGAVKEEEGIVGHGVSGAPKAGSPGKRTVCDHCRRRRIRCDGLFPCQQCVNASLTCKRDHVPRKRGPKRGHGRVINELRAQETTGGLTRGHRRNESTSNSDIDLDTDTYFTSAPASGATSGAPSPPQQPFIPWTSVPTDPRNAPEPEGVFTSDHYRPTSRNYLHMIPRCVELYYEHIYPIMPLLYMPTIRAMIRRPMTPSEKNLIYAMSALTSFHMAGKSLSGPGHPPWETVGRFFLDECISVRQSYDFPDDVSLYAVISSFWLSTSFFEINQSRKSWFYLREALTLAIDIRLHDDATYEGLPPEEKLCRQRVFWILFVTERSFAILRNKPLTLRRTPSLPSTRHSYEAPEIHAGFLKLVSSYAPLDESFVNAWNEGNDPRVSATTYLNLQKILAQPLDFLRPKKKHPRPLPSSKVMTATDDEDDPDPTSIQKADLLITQQWLRLIVWQSSFRQGLLSTAAPHDSFTFSFPLTIARDTAAVLQSLPSQAVEVHGMGIFEKIFEIGTWCVNVMGAYDAGSSNPTRPFGGATQGVGGMDFVGGDLALFGTGGRRNAVLDPLEFFVSTLSASPNSKTMFADKLLLFAGETPGGMRMSLSPALPITSGALASNATLARSDGVVEELPDDENAGGSGQVPHVHDPGLASMPVTTMSSNPPPSLGLTTSESPGYSMAEALLSAGLSSTSSDTSYGFWTAFDNNLGVPGNNAFMETWNTAQDDDTTTKKMPATSEHMDRALGAMMGAW